MKETRILVVDDEQEIADLLELYLISDGYQVVKSSDALEGLAIMEREKIDLVLLDIMMPKIDGYTATRVIRSTNRQDAKAIPIIAMTAHVFDEDVKQCLEAGMNAHLPKPLQMEKVVSTIARLCKRK